jgi:hypothetical protein
MRTEIFVNLFQVVSRFTYLLSTMRRNSTQKAKPLRAVRGSAQLRNAKGVRREVNTQGMTLYSSPRTIMPAQYNARLKYLIEVVNTGIGNTQASIQFRSEAYDVDPAFASTAMPGFTEFAGFYQRYRTTRLGYKFSAANQEAFSMAVIHGFSATTIGAASLNLQYAGNPLFQTGMLGPATGQNRQVFQDERSVSDIVGTKQPIYDDLYTGSTTSATLAKWNSLLLLWCCCTGLLDRFRLFSGCRDHT